MLTHEMKKSAIDAAWKETDECKDGMSFVQYQIQSPDNAYKLTRQAEKAAEAVLETIWKPMTTAPEGLIWCRNGNVIGLVNRSVRHNIEMLSGWGFACGPPTEWANPF